MHPHVLALWMLQQMVTIRSSEPIQFSLYTPNFDNPDPVFIKVYPDTTEELEPEFSKFLTFVWLLFLDQSLRSHYLWTLITHITLTHAGHQHDCLFRYAADLSACYTGTEEAHNLPDVFFCLTHTNHQHGCLFKYAADLSACCSGPEEVYTLLICVLLLRISHLS